MLIYIVIKVWWNIQDDGPKKQTVKFMGETWRNWKSRLVSNYINKKDDNPDKIDNPEKKKRKRKKKENPIGVRNITEAQWTEFCKQKQSEEFKVS